jgi:hypothetical protein
MKKGGEQLYIRSPLSLLQDFSNHPPNIGRLYLFFVARLWHLDQRCGGRVCWQVHSFIINEINGVDDTLQIFEDQKFIGKGVEDH